MTLEDGQSRGERLSRANSGRSRGRDRADEPGRQRLFADPVLIVLIEDNVLAHADYGMISLGGRRGPQGA